MFKKILIANRGEIALRIICACRELGVKTVIAHSQADSDSLPVLHADEHVCIGPPSCAESYLNIAAVRTAAEISGVDAVHPGYGFLSEQPALAEACEAIGVAFVGPPPRVLRLLGDKSLARETMAQAGLPIVPGTTSFESPTEGESLGEALGFPLMVKATSGGGGRGLRVLRSFDELRLALPSACREAEAAFGDRRLYLERYLEDSRHVEFQILADGDRVVNLGERECTVQRRHQKLLEEAPSTVLTAPSRRRLGGLVAAASKLVGYRNAGTFEFLIDGRGDPFFIEVNARVQVEHPVTEMVSGVDIVKEQIRVAADQGLSIRQEDVRLAGHAIECRVNAEDPDTGTPSPGLIRRFSVPGGPGVRVDTYAHADCMVWPHYDGLVAKVVTHGCDRNEAIARMRRALEMTVIEGIDTTVSLHLRILRDANFLAGEFTTSYVDQLVNRR